MSGHGETTETLTLVNIEGPVVIQAPKIVVQLPEGEFKTQLERLSSQPGQEWLLQLADRPDVDWQQVALAHEKWEYQHSGLTAEAALVIVIVVAVLTQGAGASLLNASGLAAGTVTTASGAIVTITLGAAANAGLIALTSQAITSFINNKGDLGQTLSDLGSEQSVRSLVTTMLTAGALNALAGQISFTNADGTLTKLSEISAKSDFVAQLGKNAINNTVSALIDTSINGGDLGDKIGRGLFLGVVDAAGASAANWVGDLDGFSNKVGHLIVGCAMGAAKSGDCASGAVGGLVGELVAEWYGGSRDPVNATEASQTVNIARLFGALTNTLIGGDAQVGADAAGNAAQNNFLNHAQVKQLNVQLAQCQGQASCISQTIDDARALDKRQHDLIGQTETIQGSRALVEGLQRPGATIDTSLCAGVSACVQYAAELPLINNKDYIYGTQDRLGELAQIKKIHAFETQIRQANPTLSDEEVTRQAGARAGIYDAGRLGQLLGAASRGTGAGGGNAAEGVAAVERGANSESLAARRAGLNEKFGRSGDINFDINTRGNQETASGFFRAQGLSEADANALMNGIDFTRPVNVQTLGSAKPLWQYQSLGAPQGNWYSLSPSVTPSELGISPYGVNRAAQSVELKVLNEYSTVQPVSVLRSTSAAVNDFWSVPGWQYSTIGGAQQLFSTQKPLFVPDRH